MEPTRRQLEEALRYLRVPDRGREEVLEMARAGFAELGGCAHPRKVWKRFPLTVGERGIALGDGSVECVSRDLSRLFKNCRSCVVMAVTLGPEVDRRTQLLGRGSMSRALCLDACASVRADSLCDEIEDEVGETLREGEYLTRRFSPGYGDVPMQFSGDLLRLVDAERRIGLTMTRQGMMIPIKSVTALIGISSVPERRRRGCDDCSFAACQYRREGGFCHDERI
ncbi:vitamin B12 dependent-methionine synthase activation domain-containing protein [Pyramidobacter sp. C12-8]|uniref:vitamin B12 dependent-methionine synthase activation domain-containing protein n=1 Tax=Pyramidobacter sp. C12-8 TaxID=1943580 RepID=UPI00098EBD3D|nr:vitamin B12 dependent-methionine synthase activation domain-containing protein [Pyramidobacter sp. C12-8]OON89739.1 hypothetical protein B0D78_02625 [Pyramidobacter sp. C12-8]